MFFRFNLFIFCVNIIVLFFIIIAKYTIIRLTLLNFNIKNIIIFVILKYTKFIYLNYN